MASTLFVNIHADYQNDGKLSLFVFGDPNEAITVQNDNGFFVSTNLNLDGFASIEVPSSEAMMGTGVNNQGLQIQSAGDISAYLSVRQPFSTDLSIIFEEASLGTRYMLASYRDTIGVGEGGQFSVQATQDGTNVAFTLPDGQTANVLLNAGETFKFAVGDSAGNLTLGINVSQSFDLTGTYIAASAPVAVFSGAYCANIGSGACDHIIEQMPAIENLSLDYIVGEAHSPSGSGNNLVRVIAANDATDVIVDNVTVATIDQGEHYEFVLSNDAAHVQASKGVLVAQYLQGYNTAGGEGDPALSFVPGSDTWLSSYEIATPAGADALPVNLINVVIPTAAVPTILVNGAAVDPSLFTAIANTPFSVANIPVQPGIVTVEAAENFQISIFGYDNYDSYLTFGGASFASGRSNVPPVAVNDAFTTDESTIVNGDVLADNGSGQDIDIDNDPLTIVGVDGDAAAVGNNLTLVSGAIVKLEADGTLSYDPNNAFDHLNNGQTATDSFTYSIADPSGATDSATVTLTINGQSAVGDVVLTLPDTLAAGASGQAVLSRDVAGDAMLVAVSVEGGVIADPLTGSYSDTAFVVMRGDDTQVLLDVKGAATPNKFMTGYAQIADPAAISDMAARILAFQPDFVEAATSARLEANFDALFGADIEALVNTMLAFQDQFGAFGLNDDSAVGALGFAIDAAGDFGSVVERGMLGSLGQGWASLADLKLAIDGRSVQLQGLPSVGLLQSLSIEGAAVYSVSQSAGRTVTLSGNVLGIGLGTRPSFEQRFDGQFVTGGDYAGTLLQTDSGYSLNNVDGGVLLFDGDGNFLKSISSDGSEIAATHDVAMNITALTATNGDALMFQYDGANRLTRIEDNEGRTANFTYDAQDRLVEVVRAEGVSSFDYNGDGDLVQATAPGLAASQFSYDALGRLIGADYGGGLQSESFTYDAVGSMTITDGAGRQTQVDLLPGNTAGRVTDGLGGASELVFDADGKLVGIQAADGTQTQLGFDEAGRIISITDPNGAQFGFNYAGEDVRPASFTDANGNVRLFTYDGAGNVTEAEWADGTSLLFQYDGDGNLAQATNRRGDSTDYDYEARDLLISQTDGSTGPVTYAYDAMGRMVSASDGQGVTQFTYDGADRVTRIDYANGQSLDYTYNTAGQRASVSDGGSYNIFYEYDGLGRLVRLSDETDTLVQYSYDAAGNLVQEANGNGTVSNFSYDAAGRLTQIENLAPDNSVNSFFDHTYDAAGQRVGVDTIDGSWSYGYDALGQLISADFASTNGAIANKAIAYEYDAAGNRTRMVEDGAETLYTVNALNQYTQIGNATFTYDADGNMASRTDPSGTTTYAYDINNRLIGVNDADGTVTSYQYDVLGNRIGKMVDGVQTDYVVDPFGMGDVLAEYTGGVLTASYAHGLGLVSGEVGGQDLFFDGDALGSVATVTGTGGAVQNSYVFTPFGRELFEHETVANDFEFNGLLGVAEDSEDLSFMRARYYDSQAGRFTSEDPLGLSGGSFNLYSFVSNIPTALADPSGQFVISIGGSVNTNFLLGGGVEVGLFVDVEWGKFDLGAFLGVEAGAGANFSGDLGVGYFKDRESFEGTSFNGSANIGALGGDVFFSSEPGHGGGLIGGRVGVGIGAGADVSVGNTVAGSIGDIIRSLKDGSDDTPSTPPPSLDPDSPVFGPFLPPEPDYGTDPEPEGEIFGPFLPAENQTRIEPAQGDGRNDGDPHFRTFDGLGYSLQAAGEFTMVLGEGFEIQTRMEPINDSVSVNTATAMNIGDNIVGIYAQEAIPLVVNGAAVPLARGESVAVGEGTVYRGFFGSHDEFGNFDVYVVTDANGNGFWVNVYSGANHIRAFVDDGQTIAGLMGNFDGDRANDFALRDGTVLAQPIGETVLHGEFADSWRITQDQSFFLYRDGETTADYTDKNFPYQSVTLDDLDPADRAAAEQIALDAGLVPGTFEFETTVLDIALTGDPNFAEGVAGAPNVGADQNPTPTTPAQINEAPTPQDDRAWVRSGDTIVVDVLANDTDPENDPLTLVGGTDPNGGTVSVVNGQLQFTPANNFLGDALVEYSVTDTANNISTATAVITVVDGQTSIIDGTPNDDVLIGTNNFDIINGFEGNDVISPLVANDLIDGGDGSDTVNYSTSPNGVMIDLAAGTVSGSGDDLLTSIENAIGAAFDDVILGSADSNAIKGGEGNDNIDAGDGDDNVEAGAGDDIAEGGAGTDTYAFRDATQGVRFDLGNVRNPQLISAELGTDLVSGFERADGSDFNDVLLAANAGGELIGRKGGDSLIGRAGDDVLNGGAGKDVLLGKGGNDTIIGGSGDDFIRGGEGDDNIDGGSGTDTADYGSRAEAIDVDLAAGTVAVGTTGEVDMLANVENIIATAHDDVLAGDGNDNSLNGKDGNDTIDGRAGNDTLIGEAGDDNIEGGDGNDAIYGGTGADTLSDGAGDDTVAGQEGDDLLISGLGTDRIDGGDGVDTVTYDAFTDGVFANLGSRSAFFLGGLPGLQDRLLNIENLIGTGVNDTLVGSSSNNQITAGLGDDFARGQAGDDVIDAGDGNDTLLGDDGNDTLIGGEGDDFFRGGAGDDDMDGGNGTNLADYSDIGDGVTVDLRIVGPQAVSALGGNDSLTNINNLQASNFDSTLIGNDNANTLLGRGANDTLDGQGGNDLLLGRDGDDILRPGTTDGVGVDTVRGDNGFDIVDFEGETNNVTVDLAAGTATRTDGDPSINALLTSVEGARGGDGDDTLTGDAGDNLLGGRSGSNTLDGGDGNDTIELGTGFDSGTGGAGFDVGDYSQITAEQLNIRFAASGNLVTNHMSTGVLHDLIADMEGARGGQLGDLITMVNEAGHLAAGQGGDDSMVSKGNSDILLGEAGNDTIRNDTGGSDVLAGGDGDDVIEDLVSFPAATSNLMSGGAGADVLTGGEGDDVLFGGAGDDVLTAGNIARGSNAGPTVSGATFTGLENDLDGMINGVLANMGLDPTRTLIDLSVLDAARSEANGLDTSFAGTNALVGGSLFIGFDANDGEQTDILAGGDGNDQLFGANENHVIMFGGAGDDLLDGERARGLVMMGGDGNDTLLANVNNSRTISVMDGGDGADTITGSNVTDTLIVGSNGTATADTADGGDGNDRLIAAHDNGLSELLGGAGNDVFEVHAVNQNVSVLDFTSGQDLFELNTGGTVTDFASLQAFLTAPDTFVIGGLTTTLVGVDIAADLSDADFIFV